jgi:GNAT superfamily N-acetyltransferase
MEITLCEMSDYFQIVEQFDEFWDVPLTRYFHNPMLVSEFGNSAFVIKDNGQVGAYLFGFISQKDRTVGYVHLIAVKRLYRGKGLGKKLYERFADYARGKGCAKLKAVTATTNTNFDLLSRGAWNGGGGGQELCRAGREQGPGGVPDEPLADRKIQVIACVPELSGSDECFLGDQVSQVSRGGRARGLGDADVVFGAEASLESVDTLAEHPGNGLLLTRVQLAA